MLFKTRSQGPQRKVLKYFLLSEAAILLSCYLAYTACNRSQATRKYLYDRPLLNHIVKFYYRVGHKFGTGSVQAYDQLTWQAQAKELEKQRAQ